MRVKYSVLNKETGICQENTANDSHLFDDFNQANARKLMLESHDMGTYAVVRMKYC